MREREEEKCRVRLLWPVGLTLGLRGKVEVADDGAGWLGEHLISEIITERKVNLFFFCFPKLPQSIRLRA